MSEAAIRSDIGVPHRRSFVGGSDARIIMGSDEAALIRLWREKRGEAAPRGLIGQSHRAARHSDRGPQPLLVRA
jgi:predicted phage-related endonuclease